jgi:ATP-dependent helicase HrpA
VQSAGDFEARLVEGRGRVVSVGMEVSSLVADVAAAWRECRAVVAAENGGANVTETLRDLSEQLDGLVFPGWLRATALRWLREFPRYLAAARTRLEKIRSRDGKALARLALIVPHGDRLRALKDDPQWLTDPAVARYRWMVEEYRVSLFDQRLGTTVKVSPERLERQWGKIPDHIRDLLS